MLNASLSRRGLPALLIVLVVGFAMLPMSAERVIAHPLGNFTINLYSRLEVGSDRVDVVYVVDIAEIPTYQEFGAAKLSEESKEHYLVQKANDLRRGLQLEVDGHPSDLQITSKALTFLPGQGGLLTARIEIELTAGMRQLGGTAERTLAYYDRNYLERLGWHEVVVRTRPDISLVSSDVPSIDQSDELRTYPQDMLQSPLDVRSALVRVQASRSVTAPPQAVPRQAEARTTDHFAALITTERPSLTLQLVALLLAVGLGAIHALSPGHGKAIVGAYLVGARGTARHALFLGMTVTITHTLGVFVLGLITLYASRYILPEQLYPWLGAVSGGLVAVMGLTLFRQRLNGVLSASGNERGRGHTHDRHNVHHQHAHAHADHGHHHAQAHAHEDYDHLFDRQHNSTTHTHLPPGTDGSPVPWRNLLALGISGGLIPCPSALIVMLAAISLGRVGFGILLIVAFSLGLAGVLTAVGLLFVYGGRWLAQVREGRQPLPAVWLVPLASSLLVTLAGLVITARALAEAGLIR